MEVGSSDEELEEGPQREAWTIGLIFTTADPRYVGKDREEAGSVLLSVEQVREVLRGEGTLAALRLENGSPNYFGNVGFEADL